MKKIAVLTSGGDAQGMNAAIYGIFGRAQELGYELYGIRNGYAGLLREDIVKLHREDVRHIVAKGGTILGTARCDEFKELSVQKKAADICRKYGISDLIVIGGDGSYQGAYCLSKQGIGVVGVPGTIDLDIGCTEYTIGFDTAVNIAVEAIDRIADTSEAHSCFSVVEVMGRRAGFIALWSGIAGSARAIFADSNTTAEQIVDHLRKYHFTSGTNRAGRGRRKSRADGRDHRAGITCTYPCKCACFYPARRQSNSKRPCLWKYDGSLCGRLDQRRQKPSSGLCETR